MFYYVLATFRIKCISIMEKCFSLCFAVYELDDLHSLAKIADFLHFSN